MIRQVKHWSVTVQQNKICFYPYVVSCCLIAFPNSCCAMLSLSIGGQHVHSRCWWEDLCPVSAQMLFYLHSGVLGAIRSLTELFNVTKQTRGAGSPVTKMVPHPASCGFALLWKGTAGDTAELLVMKSIKKTPVVFMRYLWHIIGDWEVTHEKRKFVYSGPHQSIF